MNPRFSEYVTSGAFALQLTRSQIGGLSLMFGGSAGYLNSAASLERKGLIERIAGESPDMREYRLTGAGVLCLAMLHQAGLTNAGADALAVEVDDLRKKLSDANERASDSAQRARSMLARLQQAEQKLECARAATDRDRISLLVTVRDPLPEMSTADVMAGLPE